MGQIKGSSPESGNEEEHVRAAATLMALGSAASTAAGGGGADAATPAATAAAAAGSVVAPVPEASVDASGIALVAMLEPVAERPPPARASHACGREGEGKGKRKGGGEGGGEASAVAVAVEDKDGGRRWRSESRVNCEKERLGMLQASDARLKLEVMKKSSLRWLFGLFWAVLAVTFGVVVFLLAFGSDMALRSEADLAQTHRAASAPDLLATEVFWFWTVLQTTVLSLAFASVLWIALLFPCRVLVASMRSRTPVAPEASMVSLLAVVLLISPAFGAFAIAFFVDDSIKLWRELQHGTYTKDELYYLYKLYTTPRHGWLAATTLSGSVVVAFVMLFWGLLAQLAAAYDNVEPFLDEEDEEGEDSQEGQEAEVEEEEGGGGDGQVADAATGTGAVGELVMAQQAEPEAASLSVTGLQQLLEEQGPLQKAHTSAECVVRAKGTSRQEEVVRIVTAETAPSRRRKSRHLNRSEGASGSWKRRPSHHKKARKERKLRELDALGDGEDTLLLLEQGQAGRALKGVPSGGLVLEPTFMQRWGSSSGPRPARALARPLTPRHGALDGGGCRAGCMARLRRVRNAVRRSVGRLVLACSRYACAPCTGRQPPGCCGSNALGAADVDQRGDGTGRDGVLARVARVVSQKGNLRYIAAVAVSLVVNMSLAVVWSYHPSVVPLVQIITILRVCSSSGSQGPFCAPGSYDGAGFQRAWCGSAVFVCELVVLVMNFRLISVARRRLQKVPFAHHRRSHLAFLFFQVLTAMTMVSVLFFALLLTAVPKVSRWTLRFTNVTTTTDPWTGTVIEDPLFRMGLPTSSQGFPCCYFLLAAWLLILAFVYLPSDASGVLGWCACVTPPPGGGLDRDEAYVSPKYFVLEKDTLRIVPGSMTSPPVSPVPPPLPGAPDAPDAGAAQTGSERGLSAAAMKRLGLRAYVTEAESVRELLAEGTTSSSSSSSSRGGGSSGSSSSSNTHEDQAHGEKQLGDLEQQQQEPAEGGDAPELRFETSDRNTIVLEREVLMLSCAASAYKLGKGIDVAKEDVFPGDKRLKVVAVLHEASHDTWGFVAVSARRVVVAFRGSVTRENFVTDFQNTWRPCPYGYNLNAVAAQAQASSSARCCAERSTERFVHAGFSSAYAAIRPQVHDVVLGLITRRCGDAAGARARSRSGQRTSMTGGFEQTRVLQCTGHSLGGGLAVLCAFDLATELSARLVGSGHNPVVAATTFGCPRLGCAKFKAAVQQAVNCARVIVSGDPITRWPYVGVRKSLARRWQHVGSTVLLFDKTGNLVVNPTVIEATAMDSPLFLNIKRHMVSRYALCMMLWGVRAHGSALNHRWPASISSLVWRGQKSAISKLDVDVLEDLYGIILYKDGVVFQRQKRQLRNMGTQLDGLDDPEPDYSSSQAAPPRHAIAEIESYLDAHGASIGEADLSRLRDLLQAIKQPQVEEPRSSAAAAAAVEDLAVL